VELLNKRRNTNVRMRQLKKPRDAERT